MKAPNKIVPVRIDPPVANTKATRTVALVFSTVDENLVPKVERKYWIYYGYRNVEEFPARPGELILVDHKTGSRKHTYCEQVALLRVEEGAEGELDVGDVYCPKWRVKNARILAVASYPSSWRPVIDEMKMAGYNADDWNARKIYLLLRQHPGLAKELGLEKAGEDNKDEEAEVIEEAGSIDTSKILEEAEKAEELELEPAEEAQKTEERKEEQAKAAEPAEIELAECPKTDVAQLFIQQIQELKEALAKRTEIDVDRIASKLDTVVEELRQMLQMDLEKVVIMYDVLPTKYAVMTYQNTGAEERRVAKSVDAAKILESVKKTWEELRWKFVLAEPIPGAYLVDEKDIPEIQRAWQEKVVRRIEEVERIYGVEVKTKARLRFVEIFMRRADIIRVLEEAIEELEAKKKALEEAMDKVKASTRRKYRSKIAEIENKIATIKRLLARYKRA